MERAIDYWGRSSRWGGQQCQGLEVGSHPAWSIQGNRREASGTETSQGEGALDPRLSQEPRVWHRLEEGVLGTFPRRQSLQSVRGQRSLCLAC